MKTAGREIDFWEELMDDFRQDSAKGVLERSLQDGSSYFLWLSL